MSRLFEALQRSETERSGTESPESPFSAVTELVEAAERCTLDSADAPSIRVAVPSNQRLVTLTNEASLCAEKFCFLAVRLRQLQQRRAMKRLLVTSTMAEEGKSLVSANLAVALAQERQQKILLLDGDLRRPTLIEAFGLRKLPGLSEWLRYTNSLISNIYRLEEPGCWFLPAGAPPENPLEVMQSGKLSELLDQLSMWFDWILIDSPPILPLGDTSVWIRLADAVLLVAREGKTEKRHLKRGLETLNRSNLIGVVLNDCATAAQNNYYQRYYSRRAHPKTSDAEKHGSN